ncbi:hypothetical protein EFY87_07115 [Flexivirga caeni]|uniref:LysM domain-containing protein n=1 Tax=Flexivirga caeni TaxID=2294115 RepID=A0A3M9MDH3_9MICO|nr:hypothetical protein EFY87_07115 [Flexivirga caeni]
MVGAVVVLVLSGAAWCAWLGLQHEVFRLGRRSAVRTIDAVPVLLWAALVLAVLWAAVLVALATATVLRPSRGNIPPGGPGTAPRPTGPLVGRLAGILLAITTLSALSTAAPALAAPAPPAATAPTTVSAAMAPKTTAVTSDSCDAQLPSPGWVPDRPARTDQVARDCAPLITGKTVSDDSGEVVVHRGDTLWSIAAAQLGPHADARAVAAEWPRWYAANRHLIGADPDLLQIGIRLQSPDHVVEGSAR